MLCLFSWGSCASAGCIFCRHNGCCCLPVKILRFSLLVLCAFTTYFAYYYTMYHLPSHLSAVIRGCCLCRMATLMMIGHCLCCFAIGMLSCLCQAALPAMLLWLYLSSCRCHAALQSPCCVVQSPCFTAIILQCYSDAPLTLSKLR